MLWLGMTRMAPTGQNFVPINLLRCKQLFPRNMVCRNGQEQKRWLRFQSHVVDQCIMHHGPMDHDEKKKPFLKFA